MLPPRDVPPALPPDFSGVLLNAICRLVLPLLLLVGLTSIVLLTVVLYVRALPFLYHMAPDAEVPQLTQLVMRGALPMMGATALLTMGVGSWGVIASRRHQLLAMLLQLLVLAVHACHMAIIVAGGYVPVLRLLEALSKGAHP